MNRSKAISVLDSDDLALPGNAVMTDDMLDREWNCSHIMLGKLIIKLQNVYGCKWLHYFIHGDSNSKSGLF
jgi:hypothetical protein